MPDDADGQSANSPPLSVLIASRTPSRVQPARSDQPNAFKAAPRPYWLPSGIIHRLLVIAQLILGIGLVKGGAVQNPELPVLCAILADRLCRKLEMRRALDRRLRSTRFRPGK